MTDRKKPGVAFWATVGLAVVLAYLLGTGPAIWLESRELLPPIGQRALVIVYAPLIWAGDNSDAVVGVYMWYTDFWRSNEPRLLELEIH